MKWKEKERNEMKGKIVKKGNEMKTGRRNDDVRLGSST